MIIQTGTFATPHASKYLQQLCKHFAHRVEATFDAERGMVRFPFGPAELTATKTELVAHMRCQDAASLPQARGVIDSHLKTFAFRESFETMAWSTPCELNEEPGGETPGITNS